MDSVDGPIIEQPDDILLRVTSTAICGSDLHIYNGFFPQVKDMVMGHEFMGVVEEGGPEVTKLKKGDRVVVPFVIACGQCFFCQQGYHPNCEHTNPDKYGPEGDLLKGKEVACLVLPICMVVIAEVRRSMFVYQKPHWNVPEETVRLILQATTEVKTLSK